MPIPASPSGQFRVVIEVEEQQPQEAEKLTRRVFEKEDQRLLGATFEELLDRMPKGELFLLARTPKGRLVGTVRFAFSGGLGEIHSLVVKESHRRRGVGTALLRAAEEIAAAHNLHAITLTVPTILPQAITFYQRLGYKRAALLTKGRLGLDWVILTKHLHTPTYPWLTHTPTR